MFEKYIFANVLRIEKNVTHLNQFLNFWVAVYLSKMLMILNQQEYILILYIITVSCCKIFLL